VATLFIKEVKIIVIPNSITILTSLPFKNIYNLDNMVVSHWTWSKGDANGVGMGWLRALGFMGNKIISFIKRQIVCNTQCLLN
jgi:hypothetical protein